MFNDFRVKLLIFLVSVIYFLSYCNYGLNIWDEGVPLSGALRMEVGDRPGRDFVAYSPGRYFLYEWALDLCHGDIIGPRIVMAIIGGLITLIIFNIGNRFIAFPFSFLPCIFYLLAPSPYYYRFLTFTLLLTTWILMKFSYVKTYGLSIYLGIFLPQHTSL